LVDPGVGTESLSALDSTMYKTFAAYLLSGTLETSYPPYLGLSGTSMAAPVVTGTVALMLQANPALTPNAVKAILQYTAQSSPVYNTLTEGAGLLNAGGAVRLARFFADQSGAYPASPDWGRRLVWGTRLVRGGQIVPGANALAGDVAWGSATTPDGQYVEWGTLDVDGTAAPWRISCADACSTISASGGALNAVWWLVCGGSDCPGPWSVDVLRNAALAASEDDTVVWGTTDTDTVVWGTGDDDTVVWGTNDADTVVWGTTDADTVVWGTVDEGETVVWGTACGSAACEPVIWSRQ
jgi:hypothetical protein